jgi:hypothetical protein
VRNTHAAHAPPVLPRDMAFSMPSGRDTFRSGASGTARSGFSSENGAEVNDMAPPPYRYAHKLQRPSSEHWAPLHPMKLEDLTCSLLPRATISRPETAQDRDWTGAPRTPFVRSSEEREVSVFKTGGSFHVAVQGFNPLALGHDPPQLGAQRAQMAGNASSFGGGLGRQPSVLDVTGGGGRPPSALDVARSSHTWHSPAPGAAGAHGRGTFRAAASPTFHGRLSTAGSLRGPSAAASAKFSVFRTQPPATPMSATSPLCQVRAIASHPPRADLRRVCRRGGSPRPL